MKKIILTLVTAVSLLFLATACDSGEDGNHDSVISAADLPKSASAFVTTYFPGITYLTVKKHNIPESDGSVYEVKLSNNFEIDFDANGNWIDIDGNNQAIPTDLIPEKIQNYLTANYANQFVTSIDNEKTSIEVELSNNIELVFDLQGNFIRIDK
ncbi:PepSY-like domain-containing protein [Flavobacterium sp. NPDC079362]|uniref:PepSY-like domain-containing protein n=1 Tax=Flavobacterium sp. NPDC079362 TaxID=3390566 RepID=UPI003D07FFB3